MPKRKEPLKSTLKDEAEEKEEQLTKPVTKKAKKTEVKHAETEVRKSSRRGSKTIEEEKPAAKTSSKSKEKKEEPKKKEASKSKEKTTKKDKIEEEKPAKGKGKKAAPKKKDEKEEEKKEVEDEDDDEDDEEEEDEEEVEEKTTKKKVVKKKNSKGEETEETTEETTTKKIVRSNSGGGKLNRNRSIHEDTEFAVVERAIELGDGKIDGSELLISSWNVNGINAVITKGEIQKYLADKQPAILCVNETKLTDDNCLEKGSKWIPKEYNYYFNCCKIKKGYAGTLLISKFKPISVKFDIGIKKHDLEGRTITAEFETFYLVTCYVPNSGDKLQGLDYRTKEWDVDFRNYLNELKKKKNVILCGDLNCAHKEIDIFNPKNTKYAGFTPQERKSFTELLDSGFVDTFRHFYPDEVKYSYFTLKRQAREKNNGWRLDYFLINKEALSSVKDSIINEKIFGSDHLPIELTFNPQFDTAA